MDNNENNSLWKIGCVHDAIKKNLSNMCNSNLWDPKWFLQVRCYLHIWLPTWSASWGYSPQRHLAPNHFKWDGDEHTCPLQVEPCWHMHSVPPNKYQSLAAHLPVAFVKIVQVPSALACISHVPISWCSKWPHLERWNLVEHSPNILNAPTFCIHVNQATPHKDIRLTTTLDEHEQACCFQVLLNQHMHLSLEQKWIWQQSFLLVAFFRKAASSSQDTPHVL